MSGGLLARARRAPRLGGVLLAAFALYAAALDLGFARGLVPAVVSPPGLLLLAASGLAFLAGAAARLTPPRELAAAATLLGAGLSLAFFPLSLVSRDALTQTVTEGESVGAAPERGLPALRFGEVVLRPAGPGILSKTVSISAETGDGAPVEVGLFPPAPIGGWRFSVVRFGYAPAVEWLGPGGELRGAGRVVFGQVPHSEEEAALVEWRPDPNVMMGAGTFPPRTEELVAGGGGEHLFLRLDAARLGGTVRDLSDPDAYRWMADGRPEDPLFTVRVLRGKDTLWSGQLRAGERVEFQGGAVTLAPDVALWVELLAVRDPWLSVAIAGLGLLLGGAVVWAGSAAVGVVRRRRVPAVP